MKVKVNIINMSYIPMTEAVIVSNLIAIASLVSEIWLATDRQTHRPLGLVYVNLFKVFMTKKTKCSLCVLFALLLLTFRQQM